MAHTDGPAYQECIAIISLSSAVKFRFLPRDVDDRAGHTESLIVQPRSLLVFTDAACRSYMHEIPEDVEDVVDDTCVNCEAAGVAIGSVVPRSDTRYSITVRRALYPCNEAGIVQAKHLLHSFVDAPISSAMPASSDAASSTLSQWERCVSGATSRLQRVLVKLAVLQDASMAATVNAMSSFPVSFLYTFVPLSDAAMVIPDAAPRVLVNCLEAVVLPCTLCCHACFVLLLPSGGDGIVVSSVDVAVVLASTAFVDGLGVELTVYS